MLASAVVLALLTGCGSDDDGGAAADPTTTTSRPPAAVTASVDWVDRTVEVEGVEGFDIDFCEGDAPILCVSRDGEWIGGVELASFPGGAGALDDGVEAWVDDLVRTLEDDRRRGCDPSYALTADDTEAVPFAEREGFAYRLTGTVDGRSVERVAGVGVVDGAHLHLLVLNALSDDACLARESELPLDAADDLEPVLRALAAGTTALPTIDAPPQDGTATGWLRGRDEDGIELDTATLLTGDEAVAAAREDGELPDDGELPNDFYVDDDTAAVTSLPVADDVTVSLYDCSAGCELRAVDAGPFLRGETDAFGGDRPFVSVRLRRGQVVAIEEIYLP